MGPTKSQVVPRAYKTKIYHLMSPARGGFTEDNTVSTVSADSSKLRRSTFTLQRFVTVRVAHLHERETIT